MWRRRDSEKRDGGKIRDSGRRREARLSGGGWPTGQIKESGNRGEKMGWWQLETDRFGQSLQVEGKGCVQLWISVLDT